jgi:23S rRNA (guanine2445-N2)-methyltransferase / 23S rRNA (guanine2069-N7)-methyltransferase
MSSSRRYFAPCPKGLEYLLRDELLALGASAAREALAGVHFEGDARIGYVACLWSRLASRVLLTLAEFPAPDGDALYHGVAAIDWSAHLAPDSTLAVSAHGHTRGIDNTQYAALRVKDAIVDQFRERTGTRPSVDTERPSLRLNLALRQGNGVLSIDLAGGSLHQRAYRFGAGEAPLKENLAAAMLERAQWRSVYAAGGALVDPMCGSGTLLIEGALMAADVAPGLKREHWGFTGWRGHEPELWDAVLAQARERAQAGLKALRPVFFGFDANAAVLGATKQNAQLAGVSGFFKLAHVPIARLEPPPSDAPGLVICNPPYGERMGDVEALAGT